jgi:adenylate cyclase, class 2
MTEREIKLAFDSPGHARAAILAIGAVPLRARRLQDDTLYDTPSATLRHRGAVLRLRDDGALSAVTLKGPAETTLIKVREEHETGVGDLAVMRRVFGAIGLAPWFRYQKYREEFSVPGVTIAVDETPVGTFVELEGAEEAIFATAAALGRTSRDFILDSYRTLFLSRAPAGEAGGDMVFPTAP